ncbi:ATPase, T2SS/T4P/T4SS family [Paenibacillus sinopodophylli]|uniref:ATPase, T2SS/T4P/T4SS family n=1 Tax=Paenibacillus sinopodophylli TaxID=1837342 RepID=UPI00110CE5FF|nr:ATPase, T2SS/T4P/T4SS family [Paenibacillus sinopodophylli]
MSQWREHDFHVSEMDAAVTVDAQQPSRHTHSKQAMSDDFKSLCKQVQKWFRDKNEKRSDKEIKKWQMLQHEAVVGISESVQLFKGEIEEYIRINQLQHMKYPSYYHSLVEAIFQQTFGLGPVSVWKTHPKYPISQSARIMGRKIFFDIPGEPALQPFSYESEEEVIENIIEKIRMKDEYSHINKFNPKLELDLEDGTRVTIIIPPRVRRPTIIFRNYTMRAPVLEDFVTSGSMPAEALPLIRGFAQSLLNLIVSGEVRSGKSTLIKAIYAERRREGKVAVTIERGHSELKLSEIHEDDQLVEFVVKKEEEYDEVFDLVLRSDYAFAIVGETRSIETEIFLIACEKGKGGSMTSYHTEKIANIAGQLARNVLQRFPNRQYTEELIRVAENLHLALVMKERADGSKMLMRVSEIRLDPYTFAVSCHDIMRWEPEQSSWTYCDDLSSEIIQKMKETAPDYAKSAFSTLTRLASQKPMIGSNVEYALSSHEEADA